MEIVEHEYRLSYEYTKRKRTTQIILHCAATPEGRDYDVMFIDRVHKGNGWNCIGYNYVIYRDGSIHRGRPEDVVGAHAGNLNWCSVGVCYIGGCATDGRTPKDTRTDAQKESMYELVEYLMDKYRLKLEDVHGHYESAAKACPSFKMERFREEYKEWKEKKMKDLEKRIRGTKRCEVKEWF